MPIEDPWKVEDPYSVSIQDPWKVEDPWKGKKQEFLPPELTSSHAPTKLAPSHDPSLFSTETKPISTITKPPIRETGDSIVEEEKRRSFLKLLGKLPYAITTPGIAGALGLHREPAREFPPEEIRKMPEQEEAANIVKDIFPAGRFIAGEKPQFEAESAAEVGLAVPFGPATLAKAAKLGAVVPLISRQAFVGAAKGKAALMESLGDFYDAFGPKAMDKFQ
jgi:hypothetical protein